MGSGNSKEQPVPVAGLSEERLLSVVPIFRTSLRDSYTVPRVTTLRLKKSSVWSVDSDILDYRGFYVFRKTGSMMGCNLEFSDDAGNVVASFEKKSSWCGTATALVTLGSGRGDSVGPAVATLRHLYRGSRSYATIALHDADLDSGCHNLWPDIRVTGDLSGHRYRFLLAGCPIAQVHCQVLRVEGPSCSQVQRSPEHSMFTLEIGPWVDIAFIAICASVIDLLQTRACHSPLSHLAWCVASSPCSPCTTLQQEQEEQEEQEQQEELEEQEDIFQFD